MTVSTRKDQSQFVVHLQPVVSQVVLDAGTRVTHRLVVGLHFAVESLVPSTSQIVEHLLGAEGQDGELQETLEQTGQGILADEQDIGGELGLVDDPIMTQSLEFLFQEGIDTPRVGLKDFWPREFGEAVGDSLRRLRIIQHHETVIDLLEWQTLLLQLAGDEVVAIDVDLACERSPGLQTHVHQSQIAIQEVVIEDTLGNLLGYEARPTFGMPELEGPTGFLNAQDTDQTYLQGMRFDLLFGPGVFVDLTLTVLVQATGLLGKPLGVRHEPTQVCKGPGGRY